MTAEQLKLINSVLGELMIRKSLIEPFDKEKAEVYESEINQIKQLLNEKTNQTEGSQGIRHSRNIIREVKE